jgi:hypothetical protein
MSFTDPTTSATLGQRRMNGWGQAMAFPGPPPMTIEDPGDIARESSINVQGANIRVPDMMNAFNMSYSPSFNSPVFNYQNSTSNTNFGLQIPFMQMQLQEMYQVIGSEIDANYEARIAALETWRATGYTGSEIALRDWSFDGTTITNEYRDFTFAEGLITAIDVLADGTTETTSCE